MLNKYERTLFCVLFFYTLFAPLSASELRRTDLAPEVKKYIVLNYYDLKRNVSSTNSNLFNDILLEIGCGQGEIDQKDFLSKYNNTATPIEAVRLIERIEVLCSR